MARDELTGIRTDAPRIAGGWHPTLYILLIVALVSSALTATTLATTPQAAQAVVAVDDICRLRFTVTTGNDGLRNDSQESIRFGGQQVIFVDANGDGVVDEDGGSRVHQGGTGDTANTTFIWDTSLEPCVPATALLDGFQFEHYNFPIFDTNHPDDWDLKSLKVADLDRLDTGPCCPVPQPFQYFHDDGEPLHHFEGSDFEGDVKKWTTDPGQSDVDQDGLTDRDELRGFANHPDLPSIDQWLPQHDADPCRKTIAVEIDWLEDGAANDRPSDAALDEARRMFDNAPVNATPLDSIRCPYYRAPPRPGIQLLIDMSDAISVTPEERVIPLSASGTGDKTRFDLYRDGTIPGGGFFTPGRSGRFFYNLWGYAWNDSKASGKCCLGDNNNDFVVTLGRWDAERRTDRAQSVSFVHELGHALGLNHAGVTPEPNHKPNYLSVMSYRYLAYGLPDFAALTARPEAAFARPDSPAAQVALEQASHLDYSRETLPLLPRDPDGRDENGQEKWWGLNENTGIRASSGIVAGWFDPSGVLRAGDARGGLDWDWSGSGTPDSLSTSVNVNPMGGLEFCVRPDDDGTLQTATDAHDLRVGEVIFAGPDSTCDTTAISDDDNAMIKRFTDAGSTQMVFSPGFDYSAPENRNYANGLAGFNDWANIVFRIGVSADARTPLDGSGHVEPTQEEHDQAIAETVRAIVTTTGLHDPGPPAHGRLIDSLDPSYTASPHGSLFFYGAHTFNPREVTFEPRSYPGRPAMVLPYIQHPDTSLRRYQIACRVRTTAIEGTTFRLTPVPGAPGSQQTRWVPPGEVTVRFSTDAISRVGWYAWSFSSTTSDPWTFLACHLYEQTDGGEAPAPAPAPHPDPPTGQPPTIATLNLRYTASGIAELSMDSVHAVGAADGATFRPTPTQPGGARITLTTPAEPHTYRFDCHVRSTADAQYFLDDQTVYVPAGDATVSFKVWTHQAGPHSWSLVELNRITWTLHSCDISTVSLDE